MVFTACLLPAEISTYTRLANAFRERISWLHSNALIVAEVRLFYRRDQLSLPCSLTENYLDVLDHFRLVCASDKNLRGSLGVWIWPQNRSLLGMWARWTSWRCRPPCNFDSVGNRISQSPLWGWKIRVTGSIPFSPQLFQLYPTTFLKSWPYTGDPGGRTGPSHRSKTHRVDSLARLDFKSRQNHQSSIGLFVCG